MNLAAGVYGLQFFADGSAGPTLTTNLNGTVAAGDVFVVAQRGADPAILARPTSPPSSPTRPPTTIRRSLASTSVGSPVPSRR